LGIAKTIFETATHMNVNSDKTNSLEILCVLTFQFSLNSEIYNFIL